MKTKKASTNNKVSKKKIIKKDKTKISFSSYFTSSYKDINLSFTIYLNKKNNNNTIKITYMYIIVFFIIYN